MSEQEFDLAFDQMLRTFGKSTVGAFNVKEYVEVMKKQLQSSREDVERLANELRNVLPWVVTQEVACNGLKCREAVCMSCNMDAAENAEKASQASIKASEALAAHDKANS
jgi:hypothetical protein